MSLIDSLLAAKNALQTTQAQLQVTSGNIANLNTEGYTRKIAPQQSVVIDGQTVGVELTEIQRNVDENLLRQIREHIAVLASQQIQSTYLERTQLLFGSLADNASIGHVITDLGTALEALGNAPESVPARMAAVDAARRVTDQFAFMTDTLQQMRGEADREIAATVERVNGLLTDLHDLNQQIARNLATGESAADLEDKRDVLIKKLAEEIDIRYFTRASGEVVISTTAGRTLLGSQPATLTHSAAAQLAAGTTYPGPIDGIVLNGGGPDITLEITGGRLGGLLALRDDGLVDLQAELDRLAETLYGGLNAAQNAGTAFPPPATVTGSRSFAAADAPSMTGNFRVAVLDPAGTVVETLDIDLTALAPADIGTLLAQIDGMANASASLDANGRVVITAAGGNGIAVNELDSAVTTGATTMGLAQFLGLNDALVDPVGYEVMQSDRTGSDTAPLGLAGTLTFSVAGAAVAVAYAAGDTLTDVAAAITGALGGANIAANVVREGDGFRLEIRDADGDNFFVTDSGPLAAQLNLRPGEPGAAGRLAAAADLLADPNLLANGTLSGAAGLAAGDLGLSAGDATTTQAMAAVFTTDLAFTAAGALPATVTTLAGYAANILALNAADASDMARDVAFGESLRIALETQHANLSQVNLDEELANLVILQNAYSATARLTTTITEMMDELLSIAR